ncbi:MAG: hypothetical protein KDB90_02830 [Planctomycetes bacterium]|nr:hypothetical protein [Planctomycetota bacterium]
MIRRIGLVCLVALLLVAQFNALPVYAAMKERDVKKLLEEYLNESTADKRREEILKSLRPEDPALAQRTLKSAMKDDDKRPLALKAAVTLKVAGLYKYVKDYIDSEDERPIIDLWLVTEDEDGIQQLVKRFQTLDEESSSFKFTFDGFTSRHLSSKALEPFRKGLKDEIRIEQTVDVLRFQFDKPELDAKTVQAQWDKLAAERDRNYQKWELTGIDVLALDGWEKEGTVEYGENTFIQANGWMNFKTMPDALKKNAKLILKLRTNVLEGSGGNYSLAFGSWNSTYTPIIKDDKWVTLDVDGSVYSSCPLKRGEWQEHVWEITPNSDGSRKIILKVDGKELIGAGSSIDPLFALLFKGDGAAFLIGGYEAIYPEK